MEVLGGIASIAQLASTVYSISKTLYAVSTALSSAPSDIADLARDLETFSEELLLLSSLLTGRDGRYAVRVCRLTAKIIGDCASICEKIDRIIGKLRSKGKGKKGKEKGKEKDGEATTTEKGEIRIWGKVKWLYKEKEVLKLLARLRDLKLSLMCTLSIFGALRADAMMDRLDVGDSLLEDGGQDALDRGTSVQMQETTKKLIALDVGTWELDEKVKARDASSLPAVIFESRQAMESIETFHSALSSQASDQAERYSANEEKFAAWRDDLAAMAVRRMNLSNEEAQFWAQSLPDPASILPGRFQGQTFSSLGKPAGTGPLVLSSPHWPDDAELMMDMGADVQQVESAAGSGTSTDATSLKIRVEKDLRGSSRGPWFGSSLATREPVERFSIRSMLSFRDTDVPRSEAQRNGSQIQHNTKQQHAQYQELPPQCRPLTLSGSMTEEEPIRNFPPIPGEHWQGREELIIPERKRPQKVKGLRRERQTIIQSSFATEKNIGYSVTSSLSSSPSTRNGRTALKSSKEETGTQPGELWNAATRRLEKSAPDLVRVIQETREIGDAAYWSARATSCLVQRGQADAIEDETVVRAKEKIDQVLRVIGETMGWKTGGWIWRIVGRSVVHLHQPTTPICLSATTNLLNILAEVIIIIARYTVLESVYQAWDGMSLSDSYEESLIDLAESILTLLSSVIMLDDKRKEGEVLTAMSHLRTLEQRCRRIKVLWEIEREEAREVIAILGQERSSVDVVNSSSDSDGSEWGSGAAESTNERV